MPPSRAEIDAALARLARARAPGSFCPSEVARALAEDWRPLMPLVRAAAAEHGSVEALQRGRPVDPLAARGPIRLRARAPRAG
jgi:hypothetical protein